MDVGTGVQFSDYTWPLPSFRSAALGVAVTKDSGPLALLVREGKVESYNFLTAARRRG